jgi:predicted RNase H-like HicB family nuclease
MTMLYPIVLETDEGGAVSAYVPGLPVYAAADSHAKAERAIRAVLAEYLKAHPASRPEARVRVARVSGRGQAGIRVVGVAALVGAKRSDAKARASRANGKLGGRPPGSSSNRAARTKTAR